MARNAAATLCCLYLGSFPAALEARLLAGQNGREEREGASGRFWPFTSGAAAAPGTEAPKAHAPMPARHSIRELKDSVMLSAAFGHKTAALCKGAQPQELVRCRDLAGER